MHFDFTEDQQFLRETALDVVSGVVGSGTVRAALDDDAGQVRANTWPATYDYNGRVMFIGLTVRTL